MIAVVGESKIGDAVGWRVRQLSPRREHRRSHVFDLLKFESERGAETITLYSNFKTGE